MSSLDAHLERYLTLRRSLGFRLEEHGRALPDFVRYAQARGETTVRTATAVAWAGRASTDGERARRLSMVRGLARYLTAFDPQTEVPPRGPFADRQRSARHIFSDQEIARLIEAASAVAPAPFGGGDGDGDRADGRHRLAGTRGPAS